MRFLGLCEQLFKEKNHRQYPSVANAKEQLQKARQLFYDSVMHSWDELLTHTQPSGKLLKRVSKTSRDLAAKARQLVDELYPYCGLLAADPATEINRVWRDLHTASQHSLLNFTAWWTSSTRLITHFLHTKIKGLLDAICVSFTPGSFGCNHVMAYSIPASSLTEWLNTISEVFKPIFQTISYPLYCFPFTGLAA